MGYFLLYGSTSVIIYIVFQLPKKTSLHLIHQVLVQIVLGVHKNVNNNFYKTILALDRY